MTTPDAPPAQTPTQLRLSEARRIRDTLVAEILADPVPGRRIPTESDLSRRFGKSRATVREALKLIENEGLVVSRQGSGRIVSGSVAVRVERPITRFESATEMLTASGHHPVTRVISVQHIAADPKVAGPLGLASGAQVLRLERLRATKDCGLFYSVNYMDAALVGHLSDDIWTGSVVAILTDLGRAPAMSRAEISAAPLPDTALAQPELADFGCALVIRERVYDADGRPVLIARDYHKGDRFSFAFERR